MSYTNLNNPANYQLQSFGQNGVRTISTDQLYIQGEYYRVLVAEEDSYVTAVSVLGDDLTAEFVYAGTTIYGLFTEVSVTSGSLTAYIAGPTDIEDVWAYINAYGEANAATIEAADCAKDAIAPLLDKYYAKASLVMVPSLYKTSIVYSERPLTTDGQLAFTRSNDTATRVGPDGYIEKVRTNLVPNGLLFIGSTGVDYTTITSDSPISGVSSTRITKNEAAGNQRYGIQTCSTPTIASNTTHTISRFFKYDGFNTTTSIESNDGGQWSGTFIQNIDIASTGVTLQAPTGCTSKITNVGSGWYRVDVTIAIGTVTVGGPVTYLLKVASALSTGQGFLTAAPQLETGDIATDYIPTTATAVSVGPVANLPRLNYPINSDGSVGCPSLLLEPQRTNNALYSEQLDNAAWTKQNITVTANAVTSPSGYQDADKVVETVSTGPHRALVSSAATLNGTYSFFAKSGERTKVAILSTTIDLGFDLSNGTLIDLGSGTSAGKIENYGNGWYRCSLPQASGIVSLSLGLLDNANNISYTGNGTSGAYFWGAQLEVGAYATSYIPTLGASVTRGGDACSKTGISSLIGQTEGTLFAEFEIGVENAHIFLYTNTSNNIYIQTRIGDMWRAYVTNGGVYEVVITAGTPPSSGFVKMAFAYKENDFVLYANGSLIGSDNSGSVPASSSLDLGLGPYGVGQFGPKQTKQTLLFKTRLTNQELQDLTTL